MHDLYGCESLSSLERAELLKSSEIIMKDEFCIKVYDKLLMIDVFKYECNIYDTFVAFNF